MKGIKNAVFIGRFQPFHKGHIEALRELVGLYDSVTVVIGSSDQNFTFLNPLTISERLTLVRQVVDHEKWERAVKFILPIPDVSDNVLWTTNLINLLPPFKTVVTNNCLVSDLFRYVGSDVKPLAMKNRRAWQGAVIRGAVVAGKEWKNALPEYLLPFLDEYKFEERVQHANISI